MIQQERAGRLTCPFCLFQTKLFSVYLVLNVLDSIAYCRDLITCILVWNLYLELLLEIHDKFNDIK